MPIWYVAGHYSQGRPHSTRPGALSPVSGVGRSARDAVLPSLDVSKPQLAREHRSPGVRAGANGSFVVPVHKRLLTQPSGASAIQLSIQLHEIPVPERRYVADAVGVETRGENVRFLFGQKALDSERLRSIVVVSVFPDPIHNFLRTCDVTPEGVQGNFLSGLTDFLSRNEIAPTPPQTFREEPAQAVALTSNLISVTYVGREAELDFFHLAPNALRKVNKDSEVAVDPIVRIDLATSALAGILLRLVELEPSLPGETR